MRVAILSQDDGIFSVDFLEPFFLVISKEKSVTLTSLNLSRPSAVGRKETSLQKLLRVGQTFGVKFVLYSIWRRILNKIRNKSVDRLAQRFGTPVFYLANGVNSDEFRQRVSQENADVVIIVSGTEIIRKKTLAVPKHGFINCHSSILPSNQGLMPVFWSLLSKRTGFTWYALDEGIDTGTVLLQKKTPVQKSFVEQLVYTKQQAATNLLQALAICRGEASRELIGGSEPCYNKFPTKDDVLLLKAMMRLY